MQTMKTKRILGILAALCLMLALLPAAARADGTPAISLGAGGIANGSTVWFGQNDNRMFLWRVLADGSDTRLPVSGAGEALLISAKYLGSYTQFNPNYNAENADKWVGSNAQNWCKSFLNNWADGSTEKAAIRKTTINESSNFEYDGTTYGPASLDDNFFFLSVSEAVTYFTSDGDRSKDMSDQAWWLRSPQAGTGISKEVGYVIKNGQVKGKNVTFENAARPAFNLDLSFVFFTSLLSDRTYKLTLKEKPDNLSISITDGKSALKSGNTVLVPYTVSGTNKSAATKVYAMVTDKAYDAAEAAVKQYAELAAYSDGVGSFTLSGVNGTWGSDYHVYILAVNESGASDLVSVPAEITHVHEHDFTYTAGTGDNGNSITAVCAVTNCPDGYDTTGITLRLKAPADLKYDGNAKTVKIEGYPAIAPLGLADKPTAISYFNTTGEGSTTTDGNALSDAPSDCGNYLAQMTWGGTTANLPFSITKKEVFTWSQLYDALQEGGYITLAGDVTYGTGGGTNSTQSLEVPEGKSVMLDLNGHIIDRGLSNSAAEYFGYVIEVYKGSLTLKDSDPRAAHAGAYAQFPAGGVITGGNNKSYSGGGVYVNTGGTLTMDGGTIFGNQSAQSAGGVCVSGGTFIMNGGAISGNSASSNGGGVYVEYHDTFTMNGGTISGNSASGNGSGVYVSYDGYFRISGDPVVTGNTKGGAADNVYLYGSNISVGALTAGASIGVMQQPASVFTEGASFADDAAAQAVFFADNSTAYEVKASEGQAMLSPIAATAPTITTQPAAETTLIFGYASGGTLTIAASAAADASYDLSYQWYSNTSTGNTGGTPIENETGSSFAIPTGLTQGSHYYYCVVTATRRDNGQSAAAVSNAAAVTVKTKETKPAVAFKANGADSGTLSNVTDGMKYSLDGGSTWTDIGSSAEISLTGLSECTILVVKKGDGTSTVDSDAEEITVTKAEPPADPAAGDCTTEENNDGMITGVMAEMEYKKSGASEWTSGTGDDITGLVPGIYYVRMKANGTVLASDDQELTISKFNAEAITITAEDKEVTWSADGITIPVEGMFAIPAGAGEPTYSVTNGTGKGSYDNGKLTVTKCGTFTVTVNTAKTVTHAAGSAGAVLTVNKANAVPAAVSANDRSFDGTEKPLVTVTGEAEGGTMQYALGTADEATEPYTAAIPTKTDAGTWYVWYKAVGDGNHKDSEPRCVEVTISSKDHPKDYAIDVIVEGKGTVDVVVSKSVPAQAGNTVRLTVRPDTGYELESLTYTAAGGSPVDITAQKQFEMPAADVTVNAKFTETERPEPDPHPGEGIRFFRLDEGNILPKTGFSAVSPMRLPEKPMDLNYKPLRQLLEIPSVSAASEIVSVPFADGEYPVTWLGSDAGLLEGSAMPGMGQSVLTGHNHLNMTEAGPFACLNSIETGDRIFIRDESGALQIFVVYANEKVAETDISGVNRIISADPKSLTLITCEDERLEGGYANRRVVAAKPL